MAIGACSHLRAPALDSSASTPPSRNMRADQGSPSPDGIDPSTLDTLKNGEAIDIRWSPGGLNLLVQGHALFHTPAREAPEPQRPLPAGFVASFSPGGRQLLLNNRRGELRLGGLRADLRAIKIPPWPSEDERRSEWGHDVNTVLSAYWLDEGRVLVSQSNRFVGMSCRVLDVRTEELASSHTPCPGRGGFTRSMMAGAGSQVIVKHDYGGHAQVTVQDYSLGHAPIEHGPFPWNDGADERVDLRPSDRPDRFYALFAPADPVLETKDARKPRSRGYRVSQWESTPHAIERWSVGVPRGAVPSRDWTRLAWGATQDGQLVVCVSPRSAPRQRHCRSMRTSSPGLRDPMRNSP